MCIADNCDRHAAAKGYCHMHYNQWRRHGKAGARKQPAGRWRTLAEHVASVRDASAGPLACWTFTQTLGAGGYGHFMHRGVLKMAHVWAYELANGPVPAGLMVRHRCDNRACLNPRHLLVGTHQQNMDDKVERHRQSRQPGTQNPGAKLTDAQVIEIRRAHAAGESSRRELASLNGVCMATVDCIVTGQRWKHLLPEIGANA